MTPRLSWRLSYNTAQGACSASNSRTREPLCVAKLFRLWEKKRGQRRTGSKLQGSLGEALFFAGLFLLGSVMLAAIVTSQFTHAVPAIPILSGWLLWLAIIVLASFVLIGGGGVILTVFHVGSSTERKSAFAKRAGDIERLSDNDAPSRDFPAIPNDDDITNSPGVRLAYRLPIAESPAWQLMAATCFCLAWNGTSSVLTVVMIDGLLSRHADWWLMSFTVPFVLIGVGSVAYFVRQLRVHTGVGPTSIEVSDHPLVPGESYEINVSQSGRLSVDLLDVYLVCDEEATYHQGTDVRTESRRVFEQQVFHQTAFEVKEGRAFEEQCEIQIPESGMHSFQGTFNAVQWKLVVKGHAKGWPDYERCFPVVVCPIGNGAVRVSGPTAVSANLGSGQPLAAGPLPTSERVVNGSGKA